ncbi:MAG TPA: DNRLRE domain-containing protein, partial [candidate division WOR-3 bacterium]|nr:DNRLRE domain-containing protein [candidate division WOR-3 bacterium]
MVRILVTLLALVVGIQAAPNRVDVANLAVGEEILELRDAYARHYYEGNGRVRAVISTAQVNAPEGRGGRLGTDGRDSLDFAADAWVYENTPTTNNGTNLANRVGRWLVSGVLRRYRSFIKLDLSSIPSGVTLDACSLNLRLYTWNYADTFVNLHRVTEDWIESGTGSVTWNNQPAVAAESTFCLEVSGFGWNSWPVTELVQDWVDETYDNYGFRLSLVDETTMANSQVYFYSKDNTDLTRIPYLIVWYQMPGEIIVAGLDRTPAHPVSGEDILVSARVWAVEATIDSIDLSYSNDRVEWTAVEPDSVNPADSTHYFSIPAQDAGDSLHYRIFASSEADGEYTTPVQSVYIPFTYAISEIQECDTLVSEVTPKLGEYVHTRGIVTGFLEPRKFYIADAAGPWNGLYIYNAYQTVSVGDSIDVIGPVAEYQGLTQLQNPARFDVNGSNRAVETTRVTFDEARLEAYENVLVRLDSVRIVNAGGNFGSNVAYQCATFDYSDTMTLYSTANSAFVGTPIPDGAFTLVCNIGDYNGRQLIPRYTGDITPIADLSTVAILAPGVEMEPGEKVTPTAVFRNNDPATTVLNVRVSFRIGGFYQLDRFIDELGPGAEDTVEFNEWTAISGVHPVRAFVAFPADPDRGNDTVAMTLTVAEVIPEPGQWSEVAPIPALAGNRRDMPHRGAWLAVGPDPDGTPAIYATKGNKLQNFYRYDVMADSWTELAPAPMDPTRNRPLRQGARGASDGDNSIYMVHGNNTDAFWHYDIAANTWSALADVP